MQVSVRVSYMYLLPVCIRVLLTFIRMLFMYSYITCMLPICYPNVPVWCFSEDHSGPYTVQPEFQPFSSSKLPREV